MLHWKLKLVGLAAVAASVAGLGGLLGGLLKAFGCYF
jgi:hypothetical protein